MEPLRSGLLIEPRVCIVVLNWNTPYDTWDCLKSLAKLNYSNYSVLIIDNGSEDNSVEILTKAIGNLSNVVLLETRENLGFSGGVNYGIQESLQRGSDYTWLLNSDTEVEMNCLQNLIKAMEENSTVGIAGSKILMHSQKDIIWHAGASLGKYFGQPRHTGMGAYTGDQNYSNNKPVDYVTGCSFLIRTDVIKTVGMMDDRFFLYYEEVDLCYRARRYGWQILYVADSQLWHKVAGSSSGHHVRSYYEVRNRLLFTLKNNPQKLFFVLWYLVIQEILRPLVRNRWKVARFALLGLVDFFFSRFQKLRFGT